MAGSFLDLTAVHASSSPASGKGNFVDLSLLSPAGGIFATTIQSISPTFTFASWGSQPVAVTGSGFTTATSLKLNGLSVSGLKIISDSVLVGTASVSANAGTGSVIVTTPNGVATLPSAFVYQDDPLTIFSGSTNLDAWWEPRALSTSLTGALTTLGDLTTNGNSMDFITGTLFHASDSTYNGRSSVEFLGVSGSMMRRAAVTVNSGGNFTHFFMWTVVRQTGVAASDGVIMTYDHVPTAGEFTMDIPHFQSNQPRCSGGGVAASWTSSTAGTACAVAATVDFGASPLHITSSVSVNNATPVTASASSLTIYASGKSIAFSTVYNGSQNFLSMSMASAVVAHADPTTLQLAQLQQYAHLAFGV